MKRWILFLLLCALLAGAGAAVASEPGALPRAAEQTSQGLTIAVDPRLELLSIAQYIGKDNINVRYGLMSRYYTQYKNDVDNHFRQHDTHEAVAYFDRVTVAAEESGGYAFDEPVSLILLMREDYTVDEEAFAGYAATRGGLVWGTPEKAQEFFDLLRDFARDAGFDAFYEEHRPYYDGIVQTAVGMLPEEDLIGAMEDFFAAGADQYIVNLVTLFHSGGFGGETNGPSGRRIYANIGPDGQEDHVPTFRDAAYFRELEVHEFGHSFLPIAAEVQSPFAELIAATEYLYEPIAEDMSSHAYGSWDTVLEETILRACVIRITERFDAARAEALLAEERAAGFAYIDCVYRSIGVYLENRAEYPSFNSFLPVVFERLMEEHPRGA